MKFYQYETRKNEKIIELIITKVIMKKNLEKGLYYASLKTNRGSLDIYPRLDASFLPFLLDCEFKDLISNSDLVNHLDHIKSAISSNGEYIMELRYVENIKIVKECFLQHFELLNLNFTDE